MDAESLVQEYKRHSRGRHSDDWHNSVRKGSELFVEWIENQPFNENTEWQARHVEIFATYVNDEHDYADRTLRNFVSVVRGMLRHGTAYGWNVNTSESDSQGIVNADLDFLSRSNQMNKKLGDELIYITPDQHHRVLDAAPKLRDRVLLRLMWQTGARPIEISQLTLDDIDYEDEYEAVYETAKQDDFQTRNVPFKISLATDLQRWIDGNQRRGHGPVDEHVLNTQRSQRMSRDAINRRVRELLSLADLDEVGYTKTVEQHYSAPETGEEPTKQEIEREYYRYSAKSWRHGFAMNCIENGMPLPYVTYLMGHASVEVTQEKYLHVGADEARDAYRKYL